MFTFDIRPDAGEPYELKATSRDVYVWERTGRDRSLRTFTENVSLTDCYAIAHIAARRQGMYAGTLEEFAESHDLDFRDDDDAQREPDPFRPGASDGSS